MNRLARGLLVGLVLACALFCFYKLTYPDVQMWDEADNLGVLMESADAGHPFQLQRQGIPYFDKPHLWYALTQGAILLGGRNELAFRIVTACADGTAQLWDARTGAPMGRPMRHHAEKAP